MARLDFTRLQTSQLTIKLPDGMHQTNLMLILFGCHCKIIKCLLC